MKRLMMHGLDEHVNTTYGVVHTTATQWWQRVTNDKVKNNGNDVTDDNLIHILVPLWLL